MLSNYPTTVDADFIFFIFIHLLVIWSNIWDKSQQKQKEPIWEHSLTIVWQLIYAVQIPPKG